jgi:hypothetical protein
VRLGVSRREIRAMVKAPYAAPLEDRTTTDTALAPGVSDVARAAKPFARAVTTYRKIRCVDAP